MKNSKKKLLLSHVLAHFNLFNLNTYLNASWKKTTPPSAYMYFNETSNLGSNLIVRMVHFKHMLCHF